VFKPLLSVVLHPGVGQNEGGENVHCVCVLCELEVTVTLLPPAPGVLSMTVIVVPDALALAAEPEFKPEASMQANCEVVLSPVAQPEGGAGQSPPLP